MERSQTKVVPGRYTNVVLAHQAGSAVVWTHVGMPCGPQTASTSASNRISKPCAAGSID